MHPIVQHQILTIHIFTYCSSNFYFYFFSIADLKILRLCNTNPTNKKRVALLFNLKYRYQRTWFAGTCISATCGSFVSVMFGLDSFTGGTSWISVGRCRLSICNVRMRRSHFITFYVLLVYKTNTFIKDSAVVTDFCYLSQIS